MVDEVLDQVIKEHHILKGTNDTNMRRRMVDFILDLKKDDLRDINVS